MLTLESMASNCVNKFLAVFLLDQNFLGSFMTPCPEFGGHLEHPKVTVLIYLAIVSEALFKHGVVLLTDKLPNKLTNRHVYL